mgnify:FL=1|jgi:misacylated tRNA(Ala) deacylase
MIKLYENNSYLREFNSKIIRIDRENKLIELEESAFYGKGGGQPGDTGSIITELKTIEVKETFKEKNLLLHQVNTIDGLKIGHKVKGNIDWKRRYKYMKMHTALHLLCAIIPLGVTGGQIGEEKSRLDFNADTNSINKEDSQRKLDEILKNNHKISYNWIENEELEKKTDLIRTMSVKPPKTNGKIRLVKIGNIDLQPCGGTHVNETSEIGSIIITKIENKGKMNRRINISLSD